ncbi:HKD family nuclease [Bradyrhizobium sp. GM7.3]
MSEKCTAWQGQPYLDELRPAPMASVRLAFFATYSVDVSAVAAMLLALIGRNDEKGSGTVVDFAQAIDRLSGKVKILVQRGRIARPVALPKIAGILDQFVVEQRHDERTRSWHPKIALVAYEAPALAPSWRLWIGSRNLTRSRDLDIGVLLTGGPKRGKNKALLPGIGAVAAKLARDAGRDDADALAAELDHIWWEAPPGYSVRALCDALGENVGLPVEPPDGRIRGITIVSPFLSPDFVKTASKWGPEGARTLISTMPALIELAGKPGKPLAGFSRVLAYAAPDAAIDQPSGLPGEPDAVGDDAEPPPLSLHAKIYVFDMGAECIVRIGSANATDRAWLGRNSEIMLELKAGEEFRRGLQFLADSAVPVAVDEIAEMSSTVSDASKALDKSRRKLMATWSPRLLREAEKFTVYAEIVPQLAEPTHELAVGLANGDLLAWPAGANVLPLGSVPLALQSEFIQVRIAGPEGELAWMQRVEVTPELESGRDIAALARHMGLRAFHEWMRTRLNGDVGSSDRTEWDEEPGKSTRSRKSIVYDGLTLEDILSAWAKDPEAFSRVDRHFRPYIDAIIAHDQTITDADRADLHELAKIWAMARERLAS